MSKTILRILNMRLHYIRKHSHLISSAVLLDSMCTGGGAASPGLRLAMFLLFVPFLSSASVELELSELAHISFILSPITMETYLLVNSWEIRHRYGTMATFRILQNTAPSPQDTAPSPHGL